MEIYWLPLHGQEKEGHMPIIGGYRKLKIPFHIAIFPSLNLLSKPLNSYIQLFYQHFCLNECYIMSALKTNKQKKPLSCDHSPWKPFLSTAFWSHFTKTQSLHLHTWRTLESSLDSSFLVQSKLNTSENYNCSFF